MARYDYLQEILKEVNKKGKDFGGEANMLAAVLVGLRHADEMMYRWSETTQEVLPIKFHTVAEELEDLTREVLIDHPAYPYLRKDYPSLEKQEHVKVIATSGVYQHFMDSKKILT